MHILTIGLNHQTAPVELRERLAFPDASLGQALQGLVEETCLLEAAILSTCNRAEIYGVAAEPEPAQQDTVRFLSEFHGLLAEDFVPYLYRLGDAEAVQHLFRVACGLDSMVLGESQILGQVKQALLQASQHGTARLLLQELFRRALHLGKRARTETDIGKGALSVSWAAVELARSIFGSLHGRSVLLLGAGKMGELTAQCLLDSGVKAVFVANRTPSRALRLAERFGGEPVAFDRFGEKLVEVDMVISSTAAPHFLLHQAQLRPLMQRRRGRPLFLIDIAVPRDVDPAVGQLDNVFLFDIDDLEAVVAQNRREREKEALRVQALIEEEGRAFLRWLNSLRAKPLIVALRQQTEALWQAEYERWMNKLPDLTDREREMVRRMLRSFANKMLHQPLTQIRALAAQPEGYQQLETVRRLFALDLTSAGEEEAL
ncbi:MAG TPA: glutamyl-tRNA reductase [Armatimonadetes bacterium]|nr:glutamyl-tRNA reductase [Armatimonadota bacterium]